MSMSNARSKQGSDLNLIIEEEDAPVGDEFINEEYYRPVSVIKNHPDPFTIDYNDGNVNVVD